jgi:hypothetical protein
VCSTNYTECIDGKCAKPPILKLANGTVIFKSSDNVDDNSTKINLPLSITLYNYSTSNVIVTINGVGTTLIFIFQELSQIVKHAHTYLYIFIILEDRK